MIKYSVLPSGRLIVQGREMSFTSGEVVRAVNYLDTHGVSWGSCTTQAAIIKTAIQHGYRKKP